MAAGRRVDRAAALEHWGEGEGGCGGEECAWSAGGRCFHSEGDPRSEACVKHAKWSRTSTSDAAAPVLQPAR